MNRPIRLLRVIPRYAPAWRYGGSVRFSYDLDTALVERGFHVTVYTTDQIDEHHRSDDRRERLHGIDIHRFANPWNYLASQAPWLGLYPVGLRSALNRTIADFDLVHVTEARGAHARWTFAAARGSGVPVVWSPLGGLAPGVGIRKPYRRGYDFVHDTSRLVREARVLIAQSTHEAGVFEALGAAPSAVPRSGSASTTAGSGSCPRADSSATRSASSATTRSCCSSAGCIRRKDSTFYFARARSSDAPIRRCRLC